MAGCFITIEGIEGVGKSTNVAFIEAQCQAAGRNVCLTREPGGTPMAEAIRKLILDSDKTDLSDIGELMLMFAARAEHLEALIKPALARGDTVICDRFTDATFAYQGAGRGIDINLINKLKDIVQVELEPELTILLDAPPEVSAERIKDRPYQDRFEQEQSEFFSRVRQGYLEIAGREPDRVKVIDASQSLEDVQAAIAKELSAVL
jgi:dTMP kinase